MTQYIKIYFAVIVIICAVSSVKGQMVFDNAPPSIDWRQLRTPHFKIIYPANFEDNAQKLANKLEAIYQPASATLNTSPKPIPIILQNRNSVSNGFVTLSPRRSEFFTMPPQDYNFLGTNTWLDLLAVHEYRHIVQFDKSKTGVTKIARYLFGENGQAALAVAAAPRWFWEGDATLTETLFTPSGRGRIPDFNRVYRTNLLAKKDYTYTKQHLQSYKDMIPNHYVLGYNYVTHLRRRTNDPEIWEKVSERSFKLPVIPARFSSSLKKYTGQNIVKNYNLMQDELEELWTTQMEVLDPEEYELLLDAPKVFTGYHYPQLLENGNIVALRNGLGDADHFVILDSTGKELKRYFPGVYNNSGFLSVSRNRLVWNEIFVDVRYQKESSSVIKTYNFEDGNVRTLTTNSRYTGAAVSPDGYKIVTSLTTEGQEHFLVVLDYYTGEEIKRFATADNSYLSMARFSNNGKRIVSLLTNQEGKSVVAFDYETGQAEILLPMGHENVGHPVLYGNYLFFNSPVNGIDNIHVLDLTTNQRYQVTNSRYGAYNPDIDTVNRVIYFNDFQPMGMNIAKIDFDPSQWIPLEEAPVARVNLYEPLLEQENMQQLNEEGEQKVYATEDYHSILNIINPHSWGPLATSDLNSVDIGVYSDDILRTTGIGAGYEYNINDNSGFYFAEITYQGLLPIFDFRVEKGSRISTIDINDQELDYKWDETTYLSGIRIPLTLTRSKFHSRMEVGYNLGIRQISNYDNPVLPELNGLPNRILPISDSLAFFLRSEVDNGTLKFGNINFFYYLLHKRSLRDLNSRWGAVINVEHFNTIDQNDNDFNGRLLAFRGTAYFPSPVFLINRDIFKHHSLFFRYNYQEREDELSQDLYFFRNRIFMPRGYSFPSHSTFHSFSANYKFPFLYPDLEIGPVLYIKRAKLNLFYDYGYGTGKNYFVQYEPPVGRVFFSDLTSTYSSIGTELTFDINVLRFPVEIDLGVRYSYTLDEKESRFEFLLMNIGF
ncbi:MAG: hypothetical protein ACNS60_06290 [Candidatus Cyclobacteriaceae bacterium M2_1C_046]